MNNNKSKNIQKAEDINCVLRLSDRCPVILQELLRRTCVTTRTHQNIHSVLVSTNI